MDILWVVFAFICGFGIKQFGLPPLIGYLAAGFLLNNFGVQLTPGLQEIADLGVTLMLFTIGLKLNIKDLLKPEIWAGTTITSSVWTLLFAAFALFLSSLSLPYFVDLSWQSAALLAFALSFSSTVCVIKMLEEAGEMNTRHGRLAVGILVMQDGHRGGFPGARRGQDSIGVGPVAAVVIRRQAAARQNPAHERPR